MRLISRPSGLLWPAAVLCATVALGAQSRPEPKAAPSPAEQPAAAQKLPPAREILDRHVKAIGGRQAILSHSSTRAAGKVELPAMGLTGELEVFAAKPDRSLIRFVLPGVGEIQEGFNGKIGWSISALTGPTLLEGRQLEERRFDSDFYSEVRAQERYTSMSTVEQTAFDGRPCYKLRLVRRGGGEDFEFYDVQTGLRAGRIGTREMQMGAVTGTTIESEYRKFGNTLVATRIRQTAMGVETVMTLTVVEFDTLEESVFHPPPAIQALLKP
ncbi:MAG TPA: hypothetical protein VD833_12885 [Vicinamibacterales bacterium]|nr:hypothetical protein [Vicinamibacterales bacterium]